MRNAELPADWPQQKFRRGRDHEVICPLLREVPGGDPAPVRAPEVLDPGVHVRHLRKKAVKPFLERRFGNAPQQVARKVEALHGQKKRDSRPPRKAIEVEIRRAVAPVDGLVKIIDIHVENFSGKTWRPWPRFYDSTVSPRGQKVRFIRAPGRDFPKLFCRVERISDKKTNDLKKIRIISLEQTVNIRYNFICNCARVGLAGRVSHGKRHKVRMFAPVLPKYFVFIRPFGRRKRYFHETRSQDL